MRRRLIAATALCVALLGGRAALADVPMSGTIVGPIAQVGFMIGDWRSDGTGVGAGAGGTSEIKPDLGGRILIRRDHVLTTAGGAFDIYMVIYPDGPDLKAEFIDTEGHTIHYAATPGPGPSVVFESPGSAHTPGFRLTYAVSGPDRMHIRFEIAPPDGAYKSYSEGDVVRR